MALLIDGRWTKALSQLKTAHQNGHDIINFLHANVDHLLPQVETSLIVNPGEADVLRWGTLMKAIQSNNRDAVIWLQKHKAPADIQQILALLSLPPDSTFITQNRDQLKPSSKLSSPKLSSPKLSSKAAEKKPDPDRPTHSEPPGLNPEPRLPAPSSIVPSPTEVQAPASTEVQPVMESPADLQTPPALPEVPKQEVQPLVDPKHSEF